MARGDNFTMNRASDSGSEMLYEMQAAFLSPSSFLVSYKTIAHRYTLQKTIILRDTIEFNRCKGSCWELRAAMK